MKNVQINWGDLGANPCGSRITDLTTGRSIDLDLVLFDGLPEGEQHERLRILTMDVALFISVNRPKAPEQKLILPWVIWNSGGGCMIASLDYEGGSIHLSDEAIINSSLTSDEHWKIEDPQEELANQKQDTIWLLKEELLPEKLKLEKYLSVLVVLDAKTILNSWK